MGSLGHLPYAAPLLTTSCSPSPSLRPAPLGNVLPLCCFLCSDVDSTGGNEFYYDTVTRRVSDGPPASPQTAVNAVCMLHLDTDGDEVSLFDSCPQIACVGLPVWGVALPR
jgi:hypothetical protein